MSQTKKSFHIIFEHFLILGFPLFGRIFNFRFRSDHRIYRMVALFVCHRNAPFFSPCLPLSLALSLLRCCYTISAWNKIIFFSHDDKYWCIEIITIRFSNFRCDYLPAFLFFFFLLRHCNHNNKKWTERNETEWGREIAFGNNARQSIINTMILLFSILLFCVCVRFCFHCILHRFMFFFSGMIKTLAIESIENLHEN